MYRFALSALFLVAAVPAPAAPEKPDDSGVVEKAVTQPLSDVNIKKRDIPAELLAIRDAPYAADDLRSCNQLIAAIEQLDAVLGPDFDQVRMEEKGEKRKDTAGKLAGGIVSSFIPFRGVVREVSGANKADDEFRTAVYAGAVRRAYLKGLGQSRRCRPPARPLNDQEQARSAATIVAGGADGEEK